MNEDRQNRGMKKPKAKGHLLKKESRL